jgi:hypothetical protein
MEALKATNTTKEMLERMGGQMKLWQHEGQFVDPRIIHLSDVVLEEVRMMEGEPLVVLTVGPPLCACLWAVLRCSAPDFALIYVVLRRRSAPVQE